MTRKECSDVCRARGLKELAEFGGDQVRVFDLPDDPDLHIVNNEEREASWVAVSVSVLEISRPDRHFTAVRL